MTVSAEVMGVLIALLAVGVAVAGLALAGIRGIRTEMRAQRLELVARMDATGQDADRRFQVMEQKLEVRFQVMEQKFEARFQAMEQKFEQRLEKLDMRLQAVEHGQAKLEGLLEGLREAIAGRGAA